MSKRIDKKWFPKAVDILNSREVPMQDFHIHTKFTDGKASVEEVFEKAVSIGLKAIAITEHTEPWLAKDIKWFDAFLGEFELCKAKYAQKISAFIGVEAYATSFRGDVFMTDDMRKYSNLILGAAHRYPDLENRRVKDLKANEAIELEFKTLMGIAESKEIDVIAHIGATCAKYCSPFPRTLVREIVSKASHNSIAIEINPVYHQPLIEMLEICAEENAYVSLGSNAHGFNDIGMIVNSLKKCLN